MCRRMQRGRPAAGRRQEQPRRPGVNRPRRASWLARDQRSGRRSEAPWSATGPMIQRLARGPGCRSGPAAASGVGRSTPYTPAQMAAALRAVILAAGQGTRMRSARPKVLHPLAGRPMLLHIVEAAALATGSPPVVVLGAGHAAVAEALDGAAATVLQPEPRGTGDALSSLPADMREDAPVVVVYGDLPLLRAETIRSLVRAQAATGAACVLLTVVPDDPAGLGRGAPLAGAGPAHRRQRPGGALPHRRGGDARPRGRGGAGRRPRGGHRGQRPLPAGRGRGGPAPPPPPVPHALGGDHRGPGHHLCGRLGAD